MKALAALWQGLIACGETVGGGQMITRRGVLAGLMAGAAWPAHAGEVGALIEAADLGGEVAFALADARTGKLLDGRDERQGMPPASTAKSITTCFALERLGTEHRFVTRIYVTGPIAGGVVQGDLILWGSGDPELDTDKLGDLAARLAAAGVRGVEGRYLYDARALPEIEEIAKDQPEYVGYNPAIAGLNLNYNRVNFEWRRRGGDYSLQMDARGERFVPVVETARMKLTNRESPLFSYRDKGEVEEWTVAREALGNAGSRWLPVRHPGLYTAEVFRTLVAAHGINLPPAQASDTRAAEMVAVAELVGDPSSDVLRRMLRWSTNLTAEVMGLSASGEGRLPASGAAMTDWLADRLGAKAKFVDHSGLGAASRIAPAEMVQALVAVQATPIGGALKSVLRDLGMKDEDGDAIESPVKVIGKTGTLNFVSGLVGYIQPPSGREMAFAIYAADTKRRDKLREWERERPQGGKAWTRRARRLQSQLIARWAGMYG